MMRSRVTRDRLKKLLDEFGTYKAVAPILGVTRERVRQLARLLNIDPDFIYRHRLMRQRANDALFPVIIQKLVGEYLSWRECYTSLKLSCDRVSEVLGSSRVFVDLARRQRGEMISKNIEIVRELKGVTQIGLARKMHMRQSSISSYENQSSLRVMSRLRHYAEALGVPIEYIIEPMSYARIKWLQKNLHGVL